MSTSKRKSGLFGLFGRKEPSQPSVTTLDSVATSAAASAASAGASGWENSAAALRNIQNASQELDEYFQTTDDSDANLISLVLGRSRWIEKVKAYSNSSFDGCSLREVTWDLSRRRLVNLAALGATRVYAKPGSQDLLSNDFNVIGEPLKIAADRLTGSAKATTIEHYAPRRPSVGSRHILVVAIRGTVTKHDWMINLNDGLGEPIADPFMGCDENNNLYSAHSGFLACAKAMNASVMDHIYNHVYATNFESGIELNSRPMLLFTGHSAGGAVAAMLYAHFTRCDFPSEDRAKSRVLKNAFSSVNCITFGAPPVTTRPLLPPRPDSICISIVNDGDPVPRADNKYIPALLRLFCGPMPEAKTSYALPPRVLLNAGQVIVVLPGGIPCASFRLNKIACSVSGVETMASNRELPTLRWGIVGCGLISSWFVSDLSLDRPEATTKHIVQAVGSSSVQKGTKFVAEHCPSQAPAIYDSYASVYQDPNVDIIYIGTPHVLHLQNTLDAITAGKHVLCEKPIALNARDAQKMINAAKEKGTRFFPIAKRFPSLLHEEKVIGDIATVFVDFGLNLPVSAADPTSRVASRALGAGAILDIGIYTLTWASMTLDTSPARQVGVSPKLLASMIFASDTNPDQRFDEQTSVILQYPDVRATAICTSSMLYKTGDEFLRVEGSKGSMSVGGVAASKPGYIVIRLKDEEPKRLDFEVPGFGFHYEADAVAEDIRTGKRESSVCSWDTTLSLMSRMDDARAQCGLVSKSPSTKNASVGEDLARVLPDDGIPWYKKKNLLLLNFLAVNMGLLAAANGYDGSMMNGLMALPQWVTFMDQPRGAWLGFINAVQSLSSALGYPITAYFANRWGRKKGLFIGYFFICLGALLQAFTPNQAGFIIARFFLGQPSAWWGTMAPLLITELTYPTHRGFLTSLYNSGWYVGSTLAAWVTFGTRNMDSNWAWRIPSLMQIAIPIIVLPAALMIPESPRYLISQGKATEARKILTKYHAAGDENSLLVDFEMAEIEGAIQADSQAQNSTSWGDLFSTPGNRHRALISTTLGVFAQWNGVGVVSYYLALVLTTVGITSVTDQTLISGCLQIWNLIWAVLAAAMVDRLGRRPLFLISSAGMLVSYITISGLSGSFANTGKGSVGLAVVPFLFIYYGFYDIAYTPLVVTYPAEIWPYQLRARGIALTQLSTYAAIFFNTFVNPIALDAIGWKYYVVFAVILVAICLTVYFFYPETKGHTLEEMDIIFDKEKAPVTGAETIKAVVNVEHKENV
ncbi:sugar transporter [Paramyrothecium foliicola]|nr:sugar transporter [Paramyrothecium foliicola]